MCCSLPAFLLLPCCWMQAKCFITMPAAAAMHTTSQRTSWRQGAAKPHSRRGQNPLQHRQHARVVQRLPFGGVPAIEQLHEGEASLTSGKRGELACCEERLLLVCLDGLPRSCAVPPVDPSQHTVMSWVAVSSVVWTHVLQRQA